MKRNLLFFAFALFSFSVIAQSPILIEPDYVEIHRDGLDLTNNNIDEVEKYKVTNISDEPVELIWFRDVSSGCNADWQTQVCDNNLCYLWGVSTNADSNIPPAVLEPGEFSDDFSLHVWPRMNAGCCSMRIHFFLKGNLQDTIGTVTFDVRMNDPDCALTDTEEEIASAIRVFPNPMTNYFQIDGNESNTVKELVVYNLIGRQVRTFDAINQSQFDMSGLPQGIYLVGMVGSNGEILKTVRLSRQFITP